MTLPNLHYIVETYVPILDIETTTYFNQLRQDVLPHIRKLQTDGSLKWFSFLVHPIKQIASYDPKDNSPIIHLRFEPSPDIDINSFIQSLPGHFKNPQQVQLSNISGLDNSILHENDWAHAWKILGEASEFVLGLLESHREDPSPHQIVQFLHFITNPLALGHQCICIPGGFLNF